jgi:tripartite-type tricarboxylate transporter receptor subunit TctC
MANTAHVINPSLYKETGYDIPRDFKPIVRVAIAPLAIVANPKFPPNTIPELIAAAKARPNEINYGSGGSGSVTHLSFELLKAQTGIQMTHVPYKSIAPMMNDILGNQIPLGSPALASAVGNAKAGQVKILAVTSAKRSPATPQVPTVAESGYPDFETGTWFGFMAPSGVSKPILTRLHGEIVKALRRSDTREQLASQGATAIGSSPEELADYLKSETVKWSRVLKAAGVKVQ